MIHLDEVPRAVSIAMALVIKKKTKQNYLTMQET